MLFTADSRKDDELLQTDRQLLQRPAPAGRGGMTDGCDGPAERPHWTTGQLGGPFGLAGLHSGGELTASPV